MCYTGHGSVKGLRVKVFRPDSKPQWLHGIVSHHDQNSRTMTVLSDQVQTYTLFPVLDQAIVDYVWWSEVCYAMCHSHPSI